MQSMSSARQTAGRIYLVLTVMWCAITAIVAYNTGLAEFLDMLQGRFNSSNLIILTLFAYTLISLLLAIALLSGLSLSPTRLKAIMLLALLPLLAAPFDATDMFGAIVYLVPYFFLCKFYKEYKTPPVRVTHLRRVK